MPAVECPIPGCTYKTDDLDAIIVAALLNPHSATHSPNLGASAKVEKVKRPTVSVAGSSEDWSYLESRWKDYADEQLRKDLTRSAGGSLTGKTEKEIPRAMKKLAVCEENTMVARVTLHNMRQDHEETVRSFGARLRGQAGICKFLEKCPGCNTDVNYTESVLRDVLAKGIANSEIQLDLLGSNNQDMSLEEVFKFVESKEAGKRSASRLLDSHTVESTSSSYRKSKQTTQKHNQEPCSYCCKKGHGRSAPGRI